MSENKIKMKLLINKTKDKVVFAEAGKECVDFLLHILSLPLGTVLHLTKTPMVGSLSNLYGSFQKLDTKYVQEGLKKDCLLNPNPPSGPFTTKPGSSDSNPKIVFSCCRSSCKFGHLSVSDAPDAKCLGCHSYMNQSVRYRAMSDGGYVKGVVSYIIMDDLSVEPMSAMSSIALLNKHKVQDLGCVEEREVCLDMNLGLALLKASLMSKTVLTDVFLGTKPAGVVEPIKTEYIGVVNIGRYV